MSAVDGGENAAKKKGRTPPTRSPKQPLVIFCTLAPRGHVCSKPAPLALDPPGSTIRSSTSADVASCVPDCNVEHHGYELLATIDGTDTKFSCDLSHGLYSWMSPATKGGYLGEDVDAFVPSVQTGAAGPYMITLAEDAIVRTELTIQSDQTVHISGDLATGPPTWDGGFTVANRGKLYLKHLVVLGEIVVVMGQLLLADVQSTATATQVASVSMSGGRLVLAGNIDLFDGVSVNGGEVVARCSGHIAVITVTDGTFQTDLTSSVAVADHVLTGCSIQRTADESPEHYDSAGNIQTNSLAIAQTNSCGIEFATDTWNSGASVNSNGNTFTLYLLATPLVRDPISDAVWATAMVEACNAAGLRPVTTGSSAYGPPGNHCVQFDCMTLPSNMGQSAVAWIQRTTGWSTFMVFYSANANADIPGVSGPSGFWPVCGREH